ncbi:MAG: THUMP domain-containing protein [Candidatus Lokiarchaeota archaeon]|nr:THUMP domain-containing protein [Candidatus Lokiarchaeota archaeon]
MNTFNLIISSNRTYENYAEQEIWFTLLILGDSSPVIMHSPIPGILLIHTRLNPYQVVRKMRSILKKEPHFFQYILRVIPIDKVVESDLDLIHDTSVELYRIKKRLTKKRNTFAIHVKKRATPLSRNEVIEKIVPEIRNRVDLKDPDWVLHFEIIGNITGISLMKPDSIFRVISEQRSIIIQPDLDV